MKKILKDAFALFMITLVAGAMLACVYAITKEPIEKAEMEKRAAAYGVVFADSVFYDDADLKAAVKSAKAEFAKAGFSGVELQDALYVQGTADKPAGCVLTISGNGYGGPIKIAMGVTADGKIKGISILSHAETPGFGAKCVEPDFYGQFAGKQAVELTVSKEINAISGATITSEAVTNAVNAGTWFVNHLTLVGGGAK